MGGPTQMQSHANSACSGRKSEAALLVVESFIAPGDDPGMAKFLDRTMMLISGGKERTAEEFWELYDRAGFDLIRIVPTITEVSIGEGVER
ncbi:MAG: hypothetical protein KDA90_13705 [Planctomycetaceae bacterium]|nr:hypothetical protein [Planctomycetaceae bacterium]